MCRHITNTCNMDCKSVSFEPRQAPIDDDNFDDNHDDSCTLNDGHDCPKTGLSWLVTYPAWSWQSGGQGRAAAAVSWWNGYRPAGSHRLFTANDPEPTGIARLPSGVRDSSIRLSHNEKQAITGTVRI